MTERPDLPRMTIEVTANGYILHVYKANDNYGHSPYKSLVSTSLTGLMNTIKQVTVELRLNPPAVATPSLSSAVSAITAANTRAMPRDLRYYMTKLGIGNQNGV